MYKSIPKTFWKDLFEHMNKNHGSTPPSLYLFEQFEKLYSNELPDIKANILGIAIK